MKEMTVVVLGHVDHGKSTLIGRLLYDTGQVQTDRVDFARRRSHEQGRELEFAFLMDGLAEEQEQGVTIDFTQTRLAVGERAFIIADAPGHREFLKNMLSGASRAEAALLVIDAAEGVREQSRRHGYLLSLLGIGQVAVVVNKMDLVGWSEAEFNNIRQEYEQFLASYGMRAMQFIPAAAYTGDNLAARSANLAWYKGPTVLEQLSLFHHRSVERAVLRLPVQDIYRFGARRLLVGRIDAGKLTVGQEVSLWPTAEKTYVKYIECWPNINTVAAQEGQCVAVELADPLFTERGMILSGGAGHQPVSSRCFQARLVWLGRKPLAEGQRYKLKMGFQETGAWFEKFDRVIDIGNLHDTGTDNVPAGFVGEGTIVADQPVVFDAFDVVPETGRFVLVDGYQIAGGGIVLKATDAALTAGINRFSRDNQEDKAGNIFPEVSNIGKGQRRNRNNHHSFAVWLSGLSGAGKSTLARCLEERLFLEGMQTYLLDGDNIRHGLSQDLNFSAAGRRENIRRVGEVAKLFVDAGVVVLTAFISPYSEDRRRVRHIMEPGEFVEVFVKCSLQTCEQRDTKGLYKKARQGIIRNFTGIDDVYEEPEHPEIVVDTERFSVEECVEQIYQYLIDAGLLVPGVCRRKDKKG